MLDYLFGSKTRVRLLRLFLNNPKEAYFVRELTRKIGAQINAVRNEIQNLMATGVVIATDAPPAADEADKKPQEARSAGQRKYYRLNPDSLLYPELRALFLKARILLEKDFVHKLGAAGSVQYLALTGSFVGLDGAPTDIFIVGKINKDKIGALIKNFEREIGREVNYTVMTPQEYRYRRDVTDRFLYSILEGKKIVVIDAMQEKVPEPAL